jgi:MFS family permease
MATAIRPGLRGLVSLTAYWFGLQVLWGTVTTIVLPSLVERLAPPAVKTSALALVAAVTAIVAIIVQPMSGAASDGLETPWGRRRPLIVAGVTAQLILLAALAMSGSYLWLLVVMALVEVASNTAQGAYQGLLPDLVPAGSRGMASGLIGGANLAGQVLGVAVAGAALAVGDTRLAIAFAAGSLLFGTVVTVATVHETAGRTGGEQGAAVTDWARHLLHPRRWAQPIRSSLLEVWGRDVLEHRDYLWLLASRLLILMATGALQPFVFFFLKDSLGLGDGAGPAAAPLAATVALVAVVSAIPGGAATARWGRVRTVGFSAIAGAVGALLFAVAPGYVWLFPIAVPFGLALGVFLSADWALLADVVPPDEAGRYLGLSNTATAGAGMLALAIGGPVADIVNGIHFGWGYRAAFMLAAVEFVAGAWCVLHVHEPRLVGDGGPEVAAIPTSDAAGGAA